MGHPFLDHPGSVAFAHRGGSLEAEENTHAAFAHATALGFSHIETDVHLSRDGVLVVHHDDRFERMFGDPRAVADLDWSDIARLRSAGGAAVPRLDEIFEAFPESFFNIELKCDRGADELARVVRGAGALDRICVGSFSPWRTAAARVALGPGLCWSPAHRGVAGLWLSGFGLPVPRPGFDVVQVPTAFNAIPVVTPRLIRAARARGIKVQVWTVDDAPEVTRLLDMGVDGIMTDRPSLLRQILMARGAWPAGA